MDITRQRIWNRSLRGNRFIEGNVINAAKNRYEKPINTDWNDGAPLHYFCGPLYKGGLRGNRFRTGDCEGVDLETVIAMGPIWKRSLRWDRFGDGHCEGTEAISSFTISPFTVRSPRPMQALAMAGREKASFSKSGFELKTEG
jgi:hypothetical protein